MPGYSYAYFKSKFKDYLERKHGGRKISILDVGAGEGAYSDLLRSMSSEIDAVEAFAPNIEQGRLREKYDRVYNVDIVDFEYERKYDLVVFGDVIEHLTVEQAQGAIAKAMANSGQILVAVPFMSKQDEIYGNKYEAHKQEDLTNEVFLQRYPGLENLFINEKYGYYTNAGMVPPKVRRVKLAFLDTIGLRYNGNTLKERGLGGSESAIIFLGEELTKLGFEVTVFNKSDVEGVYGGVEYVDITKARDNVEHFDVLITSRAVLPYVPSKYRDVVLKQFPGYDIAQYKPLVDRSSYRVMWLHDTFILGEMWVEDLLKDGDYHEIFTLSDWHTHYIAKATHGQNPRYYEVMKRKFFQTRNGIKSYYPEVDISRKDKNLFVFNASTTKGMVPLLDTIWPRVHAEFPEARLVIIGGYYPGVNPNNAPDQIEQIWRNKYAANHGKNGVEFTGIIKQNEIADILVRASYFVYPGAFPETFGISATEALNYNVPMITTRFGALEETAPEATSYLIDFPITRDMKLYNEEGSIAHPDQVERFLEIIRVAYNNDYLRQQKMYAANEFKPYLGWDTVALQWKEHIFQKLGLYMNIDEKRKVRELTASLHRLYRRRFYNLEDMVEDYSHLDKRHIAVVSPVYNAERYIGQHILSVAAQNYDNYHHYIIDDMSTDGTVQMAMRVIELLPKRIRSRFTLIRNKEKKYAVGNQVETISSLQGNPIVALLDGDDFLANDPDIFNFINKQYSQGVRFTYGSCHSLADRIDLVAQPYPLRVQEERSYRKHKFNWGMPYTHLRTFERSLFAEVDRSNFTDPSTGGYWKAGGDNSLFYPLIERCMPSQVRAIQRVLVLYNDTNPLNDYKVNSQEQNKTRDAIVSNSVDQVPKKVENPIGISSDKVQRIRQEKNPGDIAEFKRLLEVRDVPLMNEENNDSLAARAKFLIDKMKSLGAGKNSRILDVGSSTGALASFLWREGYKNITCLDISKKVVEEGSKVYPQFKWVNSDIEKFETDERFDVVITTDVLEQLADPRRAISRINGILSDRGHQIFTTPTEEFVFAVDEHDHISSLTKKELSLFSEDVEEIRVQGAVPGSDYEWYGGSISKGIRVPSKAYIIRNSSKERSVSLAKTAAESCDRVGLAWEYYEGHYMKTPDELWKKNDLGIRKYLKETIPPAASITATHFDIWKRISDSGETAVVLEHDAVMLHPADFPIPDGQIVALGYKLSDISEYDHVSAGRTDEVVSIERHQGAHAYAITPSTAKKLLKELSAKGVPVAVDNMYFMRDDKKYSSSVPLSIASPTPAIGWIRGSTIWNEASEHNETTIDSFSRHLRKEAAKLNEKAKTMFGTKASDNLLAINPEGLKELRNNPNDKSLYSEMKKILRSREEVWIDSPEALVIKFRFGWIKNKIWKMPRKSRVLDIGSWTGTIANGIYELGFSDVTCLDISENVVRLGRETFPHLKWFVGDAESFSTDERYDIIIMSEIMEHLGDLEGTISKVKSLLNEGGTLIFTTPTEDYVFSDGSHEHITMIDSKRISRLTDDFEKLTMLKPDGSKDYEWYVGSIGSAPPVPDKKILIAFPTAKNIETDTFLSVYRLNKPDNVVIHLEAFYGYNIDQVRNLISYYAIQNQFDYVLFVDSDMILPPDTLERLLNANKDIVTGIYIQRKPGQRITEVHVNGQNVTDPKFFEGKKFVEADSVGFGCVLIKTKVLRDVGYPQFVYHDTINFRETVSEDADFCNKARAKGYNVVVMTDLLFEHIASIKLKW